MCYWNIFPNQLMVRYCSQCIQYRDKCSNGLTCQTVKMLLYFSSVDNTCVCPKEQLHQFKRRLRVPCKTGCETCLTNSTCDKCIAPLVVEQNNCVQKMQLRILPFRCQMCWLFVQPIVSLCTSTNQCFYCKDGFYLNGGACYSACPAGTVANKAIIINVLHVTVLVRLCS